MKFLCTFFFFDSAESQLNGGLVSDDASQISGLQICSSSRLTPPSGASSIFLCLTLCVSSSILPLLLCFLSSLWLLDNSVKKAKHRQESLLRNALPQTPMFDINQTPAAVYMWKAEESHLCVWPKCPPAVFLPDCAGLCADREWPSTAAFQLHSAGITHRLMKSQNPSLPFLSPPPHCPFTIFTLIVYAHAFG